MAQKKKPQQTSVAWRFNRDGSATIRLSAGALLNLGDALNEWKQWTGWTNREDCRNWRRSLPARENRRESITFFNCLSTIKCLLGRRHIRRVMAAAKDAEVKD